MTKDTADTTEPTAASPTGAEPAPTSPGTAAPEADAEVAAAKKEAAEHYDRYVRAVADHENFRKRTVREKEELRLFATSRVLEDLLPVLDNLGRGLAAARQPNAEMTALTSGVEMVLTQLKTALANHGLTEIDPVGQAFDPNFHDAISHQPSAEVPAEHVSTVVRTGYSLNGRLLRPASVVVSSGPAGNAKG